MKKVLVLLFGAVLSVSNAQKNVFVDFAPKVEGNDILMGGGVMTDISGNAFNLDHFDYYLSNIKIVHDGGQILTLPEEVYLIEPANHTLYLGYLDVTNIEEIRFGIGVPANLNTINGADAIDVSAYPVGHPLSFQDPSMHWGWTAGYIFMIVGGDGDSDGDMVPDNYFEIHSLGNQNYANVNLPVTATASGTDQLDICINCNLDVWLTGANLGTVGIEHNTSGINATVLNNPEILPVFTQPTTAGVQSITLNPGKVWFFNSAENLQINWEGLKDVSIIQVIDIQGRIIKSEPVSGIVGKVNFSGLNVGTYQVRFIDNEGNQLKSMNVVR